jgi:hypothetical protein
LAVSKQPELIAGKHIGRLSRDRLRFVLLQLPAQRGGPGFEGFLRVLHQTPVKGLLKNPLLFRRHLPHAGLLPPV